MKRFSTLAMLFAFVVVGLVAADSASAAGRLLRRGSCCEPACDAGPTCAAASCCDNGPSCAAAEPSCGCERTRCCRSRRCCRRQTRRCCASSCTSGCTSGCVGGGCTGSGCGNGCVGGGCSGSGVISEGVPTEAPAAPAAPAKT